METLVRLSVQVQVGKMAEFEAIYKKRLAPTLQKHGLEVAAEQREAAVEGMFNRIFAVESAAAFLAEKEAIFRDPAGREVLPDLVPLCQLHPGGSIRYNFGLLRAPAGPGKTIKAGDGIRQGVWQSFDVTDGLPVPIIRTILQDREDYLWFGTWGGGICRYDGACFTILDEVDGLSSGAVLALLEDRQGHLWIGTHHGGVCRYDGEQFETFTSADGLTHDFVGSILEDQKGHLWFGTPGGASRYDGEKFETFSQEDGLVGDRGVESILEDRQGNLWFGTSAGVSRYDGTHFTRFTEEDGLVDNEAGTSMLEDWEGNVWIGTYGGVSRFDGTAFANFTTADGLADNIVLAMLQDCEGNLWFGTGHGGVCRYDGTRFQTFTTADGLAFNDTQFILEDRDGDLWFATAGGVSRWGGNQFRTFTTADGLVEDEILSIFEDRQGHLWFGSEGGRTRGGLSRYDGVGFTTFTHENGLAFNRVSSIAEDREGNVWFGTIGGGGVSCYDGVRFENFGIKDGLAEGTVWSLAVDRQGQVWCGTNGGGVSRYDGNRFTTFTTTDGLAGDTVSSILEDSKFQLWFGTSGEGVSRYDGENFETFTVDDGLASDRVSSILEDRQGHLWFGAGGRGVSRYDGKEFVAFTPEDSQANGIDTKPAFIPQEGKPSNGTGPILEDDQGHLWFGNIEGGGLSRFDGFAFQTLVPRDGLANNRVFDLFQARNGDIWIATAAGVTRYRSRRRPPGLALVDVVTDRHHGPVAEIEVSTAQPLLIFEFRGQSFATRPGQMLYAYRLQGRDQGWRQTRATRVEYQNLPEGEYTFQVRAIDRDLNYSEPATVALTIVPDPSLEAWKAALSVGASGTRTLAAQVRVIAATNRNLEQMVQKKEFRDDLYFRLQPFPVRLPPLRDRREDIPGLAAHFARDMAAHLGKQVPAVSPEALKVLASGNWPGNVRELEHVVRRAVVLCRGETIQAADIALGTGEAVETAAEELVSLAAHERRYILRVLHQTGWVIKGPGGAAAILDLPVSTLRSRMKKLGIVRGQD